MILEIGLKSIKSRRATPAALPASSNISNVKGGDYPAE